MITNDFPEVKVMYVKSESGAKGARQAFDKLESNLPSLKGRKFYGLILGTPPNDEYWACVELTAEDKPKEWDFQIGVVPAGKYIQERIDNWNNDTSLIGKTFQKLAEENDLDKSRPCVEFYRSTRDMLIRVPVK